MTSTARPNGRYPKIEHPTLVLTGLWLEGPDGRRAALVCCCRTLEGSLQNLSDYGSFFLPADSVPAPGGAPVCPFCDPDDKHLVIDLAEAVKIGLFNSTPNSDRDWFYGPNVVQVLRQFNAWRKGPDRWQIAPQVVSF